MNTSFQIDFVGQTDLGLVREKNEDVWDLLKEKKLFLLADGMGGHKGGAVAARLAVNSFKEFFSNEINRGGIKQEDPLPIFQGSFSEANLRIFQTGRKDKNLSGMGTTLVAIYFLQEQALIGHVGDSRIYRFRDNFIERMTSDHSLVGELLEVGAIKPEDVKDFPYQHILTRALGTHPKVKPSVKYCDVRNKDLFLLCSDGLTNFVTDEEIKSILKKEGNLEKKVQKLIDLANEHGGGDNITLILLKISNDLSR